MTPGYRYAKAQMLAQEKSSLNYREDVGRTTESKVITFTVRL